MTNSRVTLDTAAFMDSAQILTIDCADTKSIRRIVQNYLEACYDDLGLAPRLLDGEAMGTLLREVLPRHYGVRDPLAEPTETVLNAYLAFLHETQVVTGIYEQRRALDDHCAAFRAVVKSGTAHADGVAKTGTVAPTVHRAAKVGRNDPCPCGSGKKFKKCCADVGS